MDIRRLIVALFASMAVFMAWQFVYVNYIMDPPPAETAETSDAPTDTSTQPAESGEEGATQPAGSPAATTHAAEMSAPTSSYRAVDGKLIEPQLLGSTAEDSPYPIELEIDPRGAAVSIVRLRDHKQMVKQDEPYMLLHPVMSPDDSVKLTQPGTSFVTSKVRFVDLDIDVDLAHVIWTLGQSEATDTQVWSVDVVGQDGTPIARILKSYTVPIRVPTKDPSQRTFDMVLSIIVENLTDQSHEIILVQRGPIGVDRQDSRADDHRLIGATFDPSSGEIVSNDLDRKKILKTKQTLSDDTKELPVAWAAVCNKFFAAIMAPKDRLKMPDPSVSGTHSYVVESFHLTDIEKKDDLPFGEDMSFEYVTTPFTLEASAKREFAFDCYLGPKSKSTFEAIPAYAEREYFATIGEYFYFCAPVTLGRLMMWLLTTLHSFPPYNYGVAIIVLVLVVRTLLHPITKKSQAGMMKMQREMAVLQPKIKAAKEKFPNNNQQQQQAVMEVYKEAGVNPAGSMLSCLPMMLQIPIWAALWASLNSMTEMRHAPFILWIQDLAGEDALIPFKNAVNIPLISLMTGKIHSFNLLPILLGVSQLLQAKYMPRATPQAQDSNNPNQMEQQRKMMMFMSGFFVLILYNAPAGLNLYIMCSNFFGIVEQWRIRKHLAEEEERMKAMPAEPTKPKEPRKESWLERKWKTLQKEAEEAKRAQGQQRNKKNK